MTLRMYAKNQVAGLDINDLTIVDGWSTSPLSHTDIQRLRQGKVGAQVFTAYDDIWLDYNRIICFVLVLVGLRWLWYTVQGRGGQNMGTGIINYKLITGSFYSLNNLNVPKLIDWRDSPNDQCQ